MRQYYEIKGRYPDCILFFRLGDFYEMFDDDAEKSAKILGITLTKRHETPMCGIPHHSSEGYLAKLTAAGEKVALCEQVSDPNLPGIVQRDVVRVVTPGTTFSETLLDEKSSSYTMAIYPKRDYFGLATMDVTTGSFFVTEVSGYAELTMELQRLQPREILIPDSNEDAHLMTLLNAFEDIYVYPYRALSDAYQSLTSHFKVNSLEAFGLEKWPFAVQAAGMVLSYMQETQKTELTHVKALSPYTGNDHMLLDEATLRNLELTQTIREGQKKGSLLGVLDHTQTAMGGRLLKHWLVRPLTKLESIQWRLDAVENLVNHAMFGETLREQISAVLDLERVMSRVSLDRGNPRDLVALRTSLEQIPNLKNTLGRAAADRLSELDERLQELPELVELLSQAIVDEPALNLKEGGFMRDGFHPELDELRALSREGKGFIKNMQQREIERTGINSLKVKYNRVFGYYIEISKSNLANVPENYTRKQTLVNAERFITPELKEYEEKVLSADDKSKALEYELFKELRARVMEDLRVIQANAETIAELDVLLSFAHAAARNRYRKPKISDRGPLHIDAGRHPVVETMNPAGDFVPNDITLGTDDQNIILLTGPNMSGKSTLLRQTALITLMAQVGSFVPATAAQVPLTDRIFTRVGASDNLVRGQSTFMVEMEETANILNNATDRSLIILDEIGRGTSTYDGVSLAWAILEHLHNVIGAKTLFATHYHELIAVAERLPRAQNFCVAVTEEKDGVVFLHKILKGGINKSYGIEVAKLAGLPNAVITQAEHILHDLEEGIVDAGIKAELTKGINPDQAGLFDTTALIEREHGKVTHPALERLKEIDPNRLTPLEALEALDKLKREV